MKKIIITGALGYIGTELCKLYSGFSWKYDVIAIDNRFISERVNELKRRKIRFIQADILNLEEIKPFIKVGNLKSLRTFADVRDAVEAYYLLLTKNPKPGAFYNIGGNFSGQTFSIF